MRLASCSSVPLETTNVIELSRKQKPGVYTALEMFSALPKPLLHQYFLTITMAQNAFLLSGAMFSGAWVTSGHVCHGKVSFSYDWRAILSKQNSNANWFSNAWLWTYPVSSHPRTPVIWQFLDKRILFFQEKEEVTYRVFPTQVTWVQSSGVILTSYWIKTLRGLYLVPGSLVTQSLW